MNTSMRRPSAAGNIFFAIACAIALTGCASGAGERTVVVSEGGATPTITATANSEVKVVPDKAEVGVAVTTQAATAEEAQSQNAEGVNAVIEALGKLGVDEKSVQTTDTYLNPRYDYSTPIVYGESAASAPEDQGATDGVSTDSLSATEPLSANELAPADTTATDSSTNIVGYEMTTRLSVTDLDIDQVGEVVSECVKAGANNTDGIRYYSSEYDAKYDEALAAAIEDARAKAEVMAKAGGVSLGAVYSITEGYQNTAYRYETGAAMETAAADSAMKVMPGELNVEASVTVSYEVA